MKRLLLLSAAVLACSVGGRAALYFDFESGTDGFSKGVTSTIGAAHGTQSLRITNSVGGWIWSTVRDFNPTETADISSMAAAGANALLKFNLTVDHATSFPAGSNTWYQLNLAGNSPDTGGGWSQKGNIFTVNGWHDQTSSGQPTMSFTYNFTELGWVAGEAWYQLQFGANSDGTVPVAFYLDNVSLSVVPEPTVLSLVGVGILGFAVWRRRR